MSGGRAPIQVGLVPAGPLREEFRRFLELADEVVPDLRAREEPFVIVLEAGDRLLCRCHPGPRQVQVVLGPTLAETVGCRSHEDFTDILARLLQRERERLGLGLLAG